MYGVCRFSRYDVSSIRVIPAYEVRMARARTDKNVKARDCKCLLLRLPPQHATKLRRIASEKGLSMAAYVEHIVLPAIEMEGNHAPVRTA